MTVLGIERPGIRRRTLSVLHRFADKGLVSANLSAVPTETMASYLEAGITHYCHPRAGGDPFSRRQSKWIPACAGMTLEIDGFRQSLFLTCAKQGKSAFRWGKARATVGLGEIMRSPEIDEEPLTRGSTSLPRVGYRAGAMATGSVMTECPARRRDSE